MKLSIRRLAIAGLSAVLLTPAMAPTSPAGAIAVGNYVTEFQNVNMQGVTDVEINRTTGAVYAVGMSRTTLDSSGQISAEDADRFIGFLSKIDITGKPVWTKQIGYNVGDVWNPRITRDSAGNLYVIMMQVTDVSNGTIFKIVVEKWTDGGVRKWRIDMGGPSRNFSPDISFGFSELYVSYASQESQLVGRGDFDIILSRLNPSSGQIVRQTLIGSSGADMPTSITTMPNGNVAVVGYTTGRLYCCRSAGRTDEDHFLIEIGPNLGPVVMGRQWGTRANDRSNDVVALSGGGFVVVGSTAGQPAQTQNAGKIDGVVTKIAANGNFIWDKLIGSNQDDELYGVEQSVVTGNVLVAGYTQGVTFGGSAGECDVIGATLNSQTGDLLYSKQFGTSKCDFGTSLVLRGDGSPVIGGRTYGSFDAIPAIGGGGDGFVLSAGVQLPDMSLFVGTRLSIPIFTMPVVPNLQVGATEQSSAVGAPMSVDTPPLCNEATSPTVKWRREIATCAGLVVKAGTTTRIRLSLRNAAGVCSLSPRRRLKLTAPGTCKVKIRATQSNGSTKAVWIKYTVS